MNKETIKKKLREGVVRLTQLLLMRFYSWIKSKLLKDYDHVKEDYITSTYEAPIDERDYTFEDIEELVGATNEINFDDIEIPDEIFLSTTAILNQGKTNHCAVYAASAACNDSLSYLGINTITDVKAMVDHTRSVYAPNIDKEGTYMVNGPKTAKDMGYIKAYSRPRTLQEIDKLLAIGVVVTSGTNKINWYKTRLTGVATKGIGAGHAIGIVGRSENREYLDIKGNIKKGAYIVKQTFGDKWGKYEGYYLLPFDIAEDILFNSKYGYWVDPTKTYNNIIKQEEMENNNEKLQNQKNILDNAQKLGIHNGTGLFDNVIKQDVIFMIYKVYQLLKKRITSTDSKVIELEKKLEEQSKLIKKLK